MILRVHPENPQPRIINQILENLGNGEIYILPTDTVYAFVCLSDSPKAINRLYQLKNLTTAHHLSLLCRDVAMASQYTQKISNSVFRFIKASTPGPYTFILPANRMVDKRGTGKKKTVGIRIVDHTLHRALMEKLDIPLASTSITNEEEYFTDPEALELRFGKSVQAVVDGGIRPNEYSTILDCSGDKIVLVRQGIGDVSGLDLSAESE